MKEPLHIKASYDIQHSNYWFSLWVCREVGGHPKASDIHYACAD